MMDQLQLGDADPGYVSCMFCTARCFKLHGSHGGCSTSSPARNQIVLQAGALETCRNSNRKQRRAPFFVKTVKITTIRRKNCELHLPAFFFKDYGDRFQKFVLLQGPGGQVWPVNLCVSCGSTTGRPTVRFSRGWKEFANDHRLELGDKLIFTLASFSRFSVQVFDTLGRKKPTSSNALSGWSFRREDSQNDERQKKSIFVNWQNKVVRESSLGLGSYDRLKKGSKVSDSGQASRVAMLCRYLKRENKTLERRNAFAAKCRARKREQPLPLSLLGQRWSNGSGSESEEFSNLNDEQADDATNLLEWEPLETASPSQLWPLALKSNDPSRALVSTQQLRYGGDSRTQAMNILSVTSCPSSLSRDALEDRAQGHNSASFTDDEEDEEDPFQAYWKHNKKSAISVAPWPIEEIRHRAKPSPGTHVLNVRPISTQEAPKVIDTVCTPPSATLISISQCLEPLSSEAVSSRRGHDSRQSQQSPRSSDRGTAAQNHMENRGPRTGGRSDNFNFVKAALTPQSCHVQSAVAQVRSISNSSNQPSVRTEKALSLWNRVSSDDNREDELYPAKSPNGCKSFTVETEISVPTSQSVNSDSDLDTYTPSKTPLSFSNSTPSRSDISLTYFLHQPRPTARRQSHDQEDDSVPGGQYSSSAGIHVGGSTSGSDLDRVIENVGLSLSQNPEKIVAAGGGNTIRSGPVPLVVRPSEKRFSEQTGVEEAGKPQQCSAEVLAIKAARCFNTVVSDQSEENIPARAPAGFGPLVVYNSSARDVSFADEGEHPRQKELALPCKRSGKENLKPLAETSRIINTAAGSVLTERNPNHPKTSPPKYECKPPLPCRKDVGIKEYLEQKCIARKSRPRVKKENHDYGVGNVEVSQAKAVSSTQDIKPYVDASSKFQLDSSSKKRSQMNAQSVNSRAISAPREDKVRKLEGTINLLERAPAPHTKTSSGNRCDLVELDCIASDDDEDPAEGENIFDVEESWDTWREIIQQRDAAKSHHLRKP